MGLFKRRKSIYQGYLSRDIIIQELSPEDLSTIEEVTCLKDSSVEIYGKDMNNIEYVKIAGGHVGLAGLYTDIEYIIDNCYS